MQVVPVPKPGRQQTIDGEKSLAGWLPQLRRSDGMANAIEEIRIAKGYMRSSSRDLTAARAWR